MLMKMQCPNCGAQLEFDKKRNTMYCEYCGTKLLQVEEPKPEKAKKVEKTVKVVHVHKHEGRSGGTWQIVVGVLFLMAAAGCLTGDDFYINLWENIVDTILFGLIGGGFVTWGVLRKRDIL